MDGIKSGELAKRAKVNTETLRYYEREGLLPEPNRSESGYRLYSVEDVQRVLFIKRSQELGFSLKEIKELLALKLDANQSASDVKKLTEQKIADIDSRIESLQAMKHVLTELSVACSGKGSVTQCPILNSIERTPHERR